MCRCPWYCSVGLLLVLAAFSWWVWPTPWRHFSWRGVPVRQHRVSGRTEYYELLDGWLPDRRPAAAASSRAPASFSDFLRESENQAP